MDRVNATERSTLAVALNAEGGAPAEIMLLPAGREVRGRDGRLFVNDDPAAIIAAFAAHGADLPIDLEHASELKAPKGEPAPAVGWIKSLFARAGALFAQVEWTEEGAKLVASKAYRYISPAILHTKDTRRVLAVVSAALTNSPNFHLPALNSQETAMDRAAICAALGIVAAATESDITAAINRLKAAADKPDPTKFVPKADLEAALNRATTAEGKLAERDKAEREAKIAAAVDQAVKDGKIAPASKDHYLALCRAEGGLEQFEKLVATLPKLAAPSGLDGRAHAAPGGALSETEKALCRQLGLAEDAFANTAKQLAEEAT